MTWKISPNKCKRLAYMARRCYLEDQKQDELNAVAGSMREGMVLLNQSGKILSINPAARKLLDADPPAWAAMFWRSIETWTYRRCCRKP